MVCEREATRPGEQQTCAMGHSKYGAHKGEALRETSKEAAKNKFLSHLQQNPRPDHNEEDFRHVFGRFQKLSGRPTGTEASMGLGLSIARERIERQGGEAGVRNNAREGCPFYFFLPMNKRNLARSLRSPDATTS